jgi:glutamate formiminotransferase
LPFIRRGGFEELAARMHGIRPDVGPMSPHPTAGAVAVGVRPLLVAYNVVLDSSDVAAARRIAAAIRGTNGGLPGVRTLGLSLASRDLVQVSMNVTDVAATTIPEAFAAVADQAERLGIEVLESEIVGLAPLAALAGASSGDLRLRDDVTAHVLETRIAEVAS